MHPERQSEHLFVREFEGEALVYDERSDKAHALNATSAFVFQLCDGTRSRADLVAAVEEKNGVATHEAEALVELALEQLSHRKLLVQPVERAQGERRMSRRKVLQTLAIGIAAIPVIVSLAAPSAAAAFSLGGKGAPCFTNSNCNSGNCIGAPSTISGPAGTCA